MTDPTDGKAVPPLPHLTGEKAPTGVKKQADWAFLISNTVLLLFSIGMLCLPLPFVFSDMIWGSDSEAMTPINLFVVTVFLPCGAVLIALALWDFVKRARRRKEDAVE